MLTALFEGDILRVVPNGPITSEDVARLSQTADEHLATNSRITGVLVHSQAFPGFASLTAFADYFRFIADHRLKVRRLALVTDSALAPVAEFMANNVAGIEMKPFPYNDEADALAWLRSS
jgi:hypothetical protein